MKNKSNYSLSLRKLVLSALVAAPLATLPTPLWALPANQTALNGQIVSTTGVTSVTLTSATQVDVNASASNSLIKWVNFGDATNMTIGAGDRINFNLPSSSSNILNLVQGSGTPAVPAATSIAGTLNSNGNIFILNPAGITLATGSVVTANGLTLSTIPESEFVFLSNGNLVMSGTATQGVTVAGTIFTAAQSGGNLVIAAKTADVSGTINGSGNLTINTSGAVNLASTGALTVGDAGLTTTSNVTVTTAGGAIAVGGGGAYTQNGSGKLSLTSGGGAVTLAAGGNVTIGTVGGSSPNPAGAATLAINSGGGAVTLSSGANITQVNGPSASIVSGNGTITGAKFFVGDNQNDPTITLNAGTGTINITDVGAVNNKKFKVALTAGNGTGTAVTLGQVTKTGDLQLNASTINGGLTVSNSNGSIANGGDVAVTNGTISLSVTAADKGITFKGPGDLTFSTLTANGGTKSSITLTSTTGSVSLPTVTTPTITVTAQNSITEGANTLTANQVNGGKITGGTFDAVTGSISLGNANDFGTLVLKDAPAGVTVVDANGFTLASGTNVSGAANLTATTGGIVLGTATNDTLTFASSLTLKAVDATIANGKITQGTDNMTVLGGLSLNASDVITLTGGFGNSLGLKNQYGQVTVVAGTNVSIFEQTTLNLGPINASSLTAYSGTSIINSGQIKLTGAANVGAGTAATPGDVNLNYAAALGSGNQIAGTITIIDDSNLFGKTAFGTTPIGNYLAKNVNIINESATTLSAPANAFGSGLTGDVNLTVTGTGVAINNNGTAIYTSGALNLTTNTGAINANNGGNSFTKSTVTSTGGAVDLNQGTKQTVVFNAALTNPTALVSTVKIKTADALTIGSWSSEYTGATTFTSGNKKNITDSVAGIAIYGPVSFVANGALSINKAGHSFGAVSIDTTANDNNATIVENGTLKLAVVKTGQGSLTATSTNADIIMDASNASTGIILANNNGSNSATFNASKGSVLITDPNGKNDFPNGAFINITALNDSSIVTKAPTAPKGLVLNNITVGAGKLTLDTTAGAAIPISQRANAKISVYGDITVKTNGGTVDLSNTGNRFGGYIVDTTNGTAAGANVNIKEQTTANLKSVNTGTAGNLTVTSEAGSIVDSVDSTVANNKVVVGGTATFTATSGNIQLQLNSDYNAIALSTQGNASIIDADAIANGTTLAASTIGGNLSVINAVGSISQSGPLSVNGTSSFTVNNGGLTLTNTANQFGPVRFVVGSAGATIAEAGTFNLAGGSVANGAVTLSSSNGGFITSGASGSTFTGALTISAPNGSIVPGANSLLIVGSFTLFSNTAIDLSGLSLSSNLYGHAPIILGSASSNYKAPTP